HPDVALVLTQLSYYYSGLNEEETDPASIYDQWILYEDEKYIPKSIKQWNKINLKDYQQQFDYLFSTLRHNMLVINCFLDYFVFSRETKQFPHKLVASVWNFSSSLLSEIITGFSGTNDIQLLLPIHIRQYDLSELQKTDTIVLNNLLKNSIIVCDRQLHHYSFVTFPASERLDCCIFYLDEIHTRGTDFKFPMRFKAAVTLGTGLTKNPFVQACMRMTKIRNVSAFRHIDWNDDQQIFTDVLMKDLAKECSEPEIIELIKIKDATLKRLQDYSGTKQRSSQILDEKQQRELEQKLEERQLERPPPVTPRRN
ncbi:unnamed protein product, partial [Rotaria sp. Silwood1]